MTQPTNEYKQLVRTTAEYFYPKNDLGYNEPKADYETGMLEIDTFASDVKKKWVAMKVNASTNKIRNLEAWLDQGQTRDGKPITDKQRKWATEEIKSAKEEVCKLTNGLKYGNEIVESYGVPEE